MWMMENVNADLRQARKQTPCLSSKLILRKLQLDYPRKGLRESPEPKSPINPTQNSDPITLNPKPHIIHFPKS